MLKSVPRHNVILQTQCIKNKINSHCCRWRVCSVNCLLYEQRDLVHSSGLSCGSAEEIKKKKISSYNTAVHDIKNRKDFYSLPTSAVPQLFSHTGRYNRCLPIIYHSVSTASCSNDMTCSFVNCVIKFIQISPTSLAAKLSPEL